MLGNGATIGAISSLPGGIVVGGPPVDFVNVTMARLPIGDPPIVPPMLTVVGKPVEVRVAVYVPSWLSLIGDRCPTGTHSFTIPSELLRGWPLASFASTVIVVCAFPFAGMLFGFALITVRPPDAPCGGGGGGGGGGPGGGGGGGGEGGAGPSLEIRNRFDAVFQCVASQEPAFGFVLK